MTKEVGRGELCLKMAISHLTQNVVQVAVTISTLNRDVVMSYVKGKSLPFASPCFFFFTFHYSIKYVQSRVNSPAGLDISGTCTCLKENCSAIVIVDF